MLRHLTETFHLGPRSIDGPKARVYLFRSETGRAHAQRKTDRTERRPLTERLKNSGVRKEAEFLAYVASLVTEEITGRIS